MKQNSKNQDDLGLSGILFTRWAKSTEYDMCVDTAWLGGCVQLWTFKTSSRKQFSVNQGDLGFARILLAMPAREINMVTFSGIRMTLDLYDFVFSCYRPRSMNYSQWIKMTWDVVDFFKITAGECVTNGCDVHIALSRVHVGSSWNTWVALANSYFSEKHPLWRRSSSRLVHKHCWGWQWSPQEKHCKRIHLIERPRPLFVAAQRMQVQYMTYLQIQMWR